VLGCGSQNSLDPRYNGRYGLIKLSDLTSSVFKGEPLPHTPVLKGMKKTTHTKNHTRLGAILLTLAFAHSVNAMTSTDGTVLKDFDTGLLEGWSERSFDGNTQYELVSEQGVNVLKGHTRQQASILYKEETVDLLDTPIVNWSWKIDRTYPDIEEQTRDGDDFPARLYVVAQVGFLPWETLAINYVWASEVPLGEAWTSPFTDKAKMVAIQSGDTYVGDWTSHSRNVAEDFKNFFDKDIKEIDGFAVMVDGDNAQKEAVAWFGQINFTQE